MMGPGMMGHALRQGWMGAMDRWHEQMATLNRQWADDAQRAGQPDLAALHRKTADAHARAGRDIEQGAKAIASRAEQAPGSADTTLNGAHLYASVCASCHGPTGQGVRGLFPPLAGNSVVTGAPSQLIAILHDGKTGPLTVEGVEYNGAMPSFRGLLSAAQLSAILSYVRSAWGNHAPAVSAEQLEHAP